MVIEFPFSVPVKAPDCAQALPEMLSEPDSADPFCAIVPVANVCPPNFEDVASNVQLPERFIAALEEGELEVVEVVALEPPPHPTRSNKAERMGRNFIEISISPLTTDVKQPHISISGG